MSINNEDRSRLRTINPDVLLYKLLQHGWTVAGTIPGASVLEKEQGTQKEVIAVPMVADRMDQKAYDTGMEGALERCAQEMGITPQQALDRLLVENDHFNTINYVYDIPQLDRTLPLEQQIATLTALAVRCADMTMRIAGDHSGAGMDDLAASTMALVLPHIGMPYYPYVGYAMKLEHILHRANQLDAWMFTNTCIETDGSLIWPAWKDTRAFEKDPTTLMAAIVRNVLADGYFNTRLGDGAVLHPDTDETHLHAASWKMLDSILGQDSRALADLKWADHAAEMLLRNNQHLVSPTVMP